MSDIDGLRAHLVDTRIAGDVATAREDNLRNIELMLDRSPKYTFGLSFGKAWTFDEVLAMLAERVGISGDPDYRAGPDRIDPDRCLEALTSVRAAIADVTERRGRVLLATGHPTGLLALHQRLAAGLRSRGCEVTTPGDGAAVAVEGHRGRVLYVGGVGVLATGAHLLHTHRPEPMRTALARLTGPPDLVVADHGWAGAAAEAGLTTVGFADCNDPALFVGEADGKLPVVVPLDDNVLPRYYEPLARFLLDEEPVHPNG